MPLLGRGTRTTQWGAPKRAAADYDADVLVRLVRGHFHYAWVVAVATFVVLVTAAGFRATPGVLIIPLEREFGWSRAMIGGAVAVNLLIYGLAAPFAAAVVERFGMRRVVVVALTLMAVGAGLTTQMTAAWQLYLLWGLVIGASTGATAVRWARWSPIAGSSRGAGWWPGC